ncbi:hypothetical protein C8J56DRAFT_1077810, partial [Mycena floridula]
MLNSLLGALNISKIQAKPCKPATRGCTMLPELLENIIDQIDDSKTTLLVGLVSRQTLRRSRHNLFSTVFVTDKDSSFQKFLALIDSPWTSFSDSVEALHLNRIFWPQYQYDCRFNVVRIVDNLPHLTALRISDMNWFNIPASMRDLLFNKLNLIHIQVEWIEFYHMQGINQLAEFFEMIPDSVEMLSMLNLELEGVDNLTEHASIFHLPHHFHFKSLDNWLLVGLKDVWDPLISTDFDVKVDSFHVRFPYGQSDLESTSFISRFLRHIGSSIENLYFNISDPYQSSATPQLHRSIDFSGCVNLGTIFIGTISVDDSAMISAMWALLKSPYPHCIQEVTLVFAATGESVEHRVAKVEVFAWQGLLDRVRSIFPKLKRLNILFGGIHFLFSDLGFAAHAEAVRRAGLRDVERAGLVTLGIIARASPRDQHPHYVDSLFPHYI